jgi:predicted nucleic-acid-binding protein
VNLIFDTNILVRLSVSDDPNQTKSARSLFEKATTIRIASSVWCEYVWVLSRLYKFKREKLSQTIRAFLQTGKVIVQDEEVEMGLRIMDAGGDFADGVHAMSGLRLAPGQATFASFDKQAVRLLAGCGLSALDVN